MGLSVQPFWDIFVPEALFRLATQTELHVPCETLLLNTNTSEIISCDMSLGVKIIGQETSSLFS
jgi:hypothetical protein